MGSEFDAHTALTQPRASLLISLRSVLSVPSSFHHPDSDVDIASFTGLYWDKVRDIDRATWTSRARREEGRSLTVPD